LREGKATLLVFVIVLLPLMIAHPAGMAMPDGTVVAVDPTETTVKVGQTFSININITSVSGLVGFDFMLTYNTSVLSLVDIQLGSFLKSVGSAFLINLTTAGQIWLAATLYESGGWTGTSANGTGILATATFQAIGAGESTLNLFSSNPYNPDEIKLASDPQDPPVVPIPNVAVDGSVTVLPEPDPSVHAAFSKTIIGQGYSLLINLSAANPCDIPQTINVAAYANTTQVEKQTLTIPDGTSTTLAFLWNTTGFHRGIYAISAGMTVAIGATALPDTVHADGWVTVTTPGDVNGDFKVGLQDLTILAQAYKSNASSSNWNPNADIDGNGIVSLTDLTILAIHFGQDYNPQGLPP
jgi:hypothetical protein